MLRDARLFLAELQQAADYLLQVAETMTLESYGQDHTQRLAVERTFILIGEALAQLAKSYPAIASRVKERSSIIGFRNLLVHRYWSVDDQLVWSILKGDLPLFREQVAAVLAELEA